MYPMIQTETSIMFVIDNVPVTVDESHRNYNLILEAVKDEDWDQIPALIEMRRAVETYAKGRIRIEGDRVFFNSTADRTVPSASAEHEVQNGLTDRILNMMYEGFPFEYMISFLDNLLQNPSKQSVDELYTFMEHNDLPITDRGTFLAFKKVRGDYKDIHSGKFDNSPGEAPEMPRFQVDDDRDNTCSQGLHFCSQEYLPQFGSGSRSGDRVMVVEINPADVVSIPSDYNNAKGRCWKYKVLYELVGEAEDEFDDSVVDVKIDVKVDGQVVEFDQAMTELGVTRSALNKRLARGVSVRWYDRSEDLVELID